MKLSPDHWPKQQPRRPRLLILDTRHPRVHLSRTRKYTQNRLSVYKAINVISVQPVWRNNKAETVYTTVGQVSEKSYRKRPTQTVRRFRQLLDDSLAISQYIDREMKRGRSPSRILHIDDLPEADSQVEGDWEHINLEKLFESYDLDEPQFQPATTFSDPDSVAIELQSADLRQPHKPVALNGHHLKFKATTIGRETFYLPTGICRLRQGWRLFIRHRDGVWVDEIEDGADGAPDVSLREAWLYFVSQVKIMAPPTRTLAPVTMQRCFTGVEGGTFLIHYRQGWTFQLRYSQKDGRGNRHNSSVRTWREDTLTNASLRTALRHLAAMDNYRRHLRETLGSTDALVTRESSIPSEFWPSEPVISLTADDLRYEVEQRKPPTQF